MKIEVSRAEYKDVQGLRELYRQEANCQIVTDSALLRAIADPYLIFVNDRIAGYGAVWNMYQKDRLMEFHTLPSARGMAATLFRELLVASQATHIEAQTNMPWMLMMLYDHARNITTESILFQDVFFTNLACPGAVLRRSTYDDGAVMSPPQEDIGDWVLEIRWGGRGQRRLSLPLQSAIRRYLHGSFRIPAAARVWLLSGTGVETGLLRGRKTTGRRDVIRITSPPSAHLAEGGIAPVRCRLTGEVVPFVLNGPAALLAVIASSRARRDH